MKPRKEPLSPRRRASEPRWSWPGEAVEARNIPLSELIERHPLTRRLGVNDTLIAAQSQWRHIVGKTLDQLSEPMGFDAAKGLLKVRAASAAAKSDLIYQVPTILKVMGDLVGAGVVKEVRFVVG